MVFDGPTRGKTVIPAAGGPITFHIAAPAITPRIRLHQLSAISWLLPLDV